ncbi:MAG: hypothetical protein HY307_03750 [Arcobacter sp.]|nr:hypothetical protein [Arcobacter sp.]
MAFSSINSLTPYNDIKKSNFYTDEVVEQILYDEIYLLELGSNITEILNGYYELTKSSNFCECVNIFYTIKYLEPKQIELLKENILLDVTYSPLNIDNAVDAIVKKENIESYSFTKKRTKKSKYLMFAWFLIAVLTTLGAGYSFYMFQLQKEEDAKNTKVPHKEIAKIEYANLPNHIEINQNLITLIKNLFESIDDNSLLKEIQIQQNESTIIYDFKAINPYEQSLKPKLLKLYEQSENILTSQHKGIFTSIISNVHLIDKKELPLKKYIPSQTAKFLSSSDGKKGLEQLFNTSTIVKLQNETKEKYTVYTYTIFTIIKSPVEFFDAIKLLEKQNYSIAIDYPIEFAKTNKGLELNFKLTINQNNQIIQAKPENDKKPVEQKVHTAQPKPEHTHH